MTREPLFLKSLVTACLVLVAGCQSPRTAADSATGTPRHIEVNGARLTYVEEGRGDTVVFVHGSMNDYRVWDHHRQAVGRHYRAVSYTQRYFGPEPWSPEWPTFGVSVHAADLAGFIRGLGAGPVHVVGWSYGASVALAMAQQNPELVKSALIYEPAHPTFVADPAAMKMILDDRSQFAPAVQAVKAGDNEGSARTLLNVVDNRPDVFGAMPRDMQTIILDNARTMPLLLAAQEPPPQITCPQLAKIPAKVSIARGELTRVFYRVIADTAAQCIGKGGPLIVPRATHLLPANDPRGFSEVVLAFLRRQ